MGIPFHPKRLFRFSIGMMLFVMLCVSGYLGGYRSGFDAGLQGGRDHARVYVKEYEVADLIVSRNPNGNGKADFTSLIDLLQTTVAPNSWMVNGADQGAIQIANNHTTLLGSRQASVLITQTQEVHDKIANLFDRLRKLQAKTVVK
jgi:hypothetical protein